MTAWYIIEGERNNMKMYGYDTKAKMEWFAKFHGVTLARLNKFEFKVIAGTMELV